MNITNEIKVLKLLEKVLQSSKSTKIEFNTFSRAFACHELPGMELLVTKGLVRVVQDKITAVACIVESTYSPPSTIGDNGTFIISSAYDNVRDNALKDVVPPASLVNLDFNAEEELQGVFFQYCTVVDEVTALGVVVHDYFKQYHVYNPDECNCCTYSRWVTRNDGFSDEFVLALQKIQEEFYVC